MTTERPKRRHAARGARIVVAGLSTSAALGLMAAMAQPPDAKPQPAASAAPAPAPTIVVVRRFAPGAAAIPSPPPVVATVAPPVSSSHSS